jgi:hypothetical protein
VEERLWRQEGAAACRTSSAHEPDVRSSPPGSCSPCVQQQGRRVPGRVELSGGRHGRRPAVAQFCPRRVPRAQACLASATRASLPYGHSRPTRSSARGRQSERGRAVPLGGGCDGAGRACPRPWRRRAARVSAEIRGRQNRALGRTVSGFAVGEAGADVHPCGRSYSFRSANQAFHVAATAAPSTGLASIMRSNSSVHSASNRSKASLLVPSPSRTRKRA